MKKVVEDKILILNMVPFGESDVIFSGISEHHGLLQLISKYEMRRSKRSMPKVDLFRLLHIEFTPSLNGGLAKAHNIEVLKVYNNITNNFKVYSVLLWIARFITINIHPNTPVMELYAQLLKTVDVINKDKTFDALGLLSGFVLFFLKNEGVICEQYLSSQAPYFHMAYQSFLKTQSFEFTFNQQDRSNTLQWLNKLINYFHFTVNKFPEV